MILLTIIIILYFILLIWFAMGLLNDNKIKHEQKNLGTPDVSVLMAVRNEEKNLGELLDQLKHQDYPEDKYEIIVVNDRSTDSTGAIISEQCRRDKRINCITIDRVPTGWAPKKWALNSAVEASNGEILLFTDGDCSVEKSWITTMISSFYDKKVGMVAGPSPLESTSSGILGDMLLLDSMAQDALAAGAISRGIPLSCSGRNLAIRRKAFDAVGGYKDTKDILSGDDDLLMHRLAGNGWKIKNILIPESMVTSPPPSTLGAFVKQRLRFASKGLLYYGMPDTNLVFRMMLPFLWAVNLSVLTGQVIAIWTFRAEWLLPWFIKMMADGILLGLSSRLMKRQFSPVSFFMAEIWHSSYVVIFGALGPLLPVQWKGISQKDLS